MQEKTGLQKSLLSRIATHVLTFRKLPKKRSEAKNLSKFYTSARTISFELFQKVCVEADLSLLIIEGNPGGEDLNKAWVDIYMEYADAIDSSLGISLVENLETEHLRFKTVSVQTAVKVLSYRYDEALIKVLQDFGYKFKFDFSDKDAYMKDLSRVISRSKSWVLRLREREGSAQEKSGGKMTYKLFSKALFALSKFAGYEIKAKDISAYDFATRYGEMVRISKMQNSK